MHDERVILLVEDNADDEALTLRALKKNNITNKVVVARDGVEAVDYLFGTGSYAGRAPYDLPQIVLLDLKLPKLDGFEVLTRLRADQRTKLLPVIILTSSKEQQVSCMATASAPTATFASRSTSISLSKQCGNWACTGWS
jgi:two-component system, response regulator